MKQRIFSFVLISTAALQGATLTTSAVCTGNITSQQNSNLSNDPTASISSVCIAFSADPFAGSYDATARANATVSGSVIYVGAQWDYYRYSSSSASASYDTTLSLLAGTLGVGYVAPGAGYSGLLYNPAGSYSTCSGVTCASITFGQPTLLRLSLYAASSGNTRVGAAGQSIDLSTLRFWDAQGNPLSNVQYTITDVSLPEPAPGALLITGMIVLRLIGGISPKR